MVLAHFLEVMSPLTSTQHKTETGDCMILRSIMPTNRNVSELGRECVLIHFPLSFNNTKPVMLFTFYQRQSWEGIFLPERLPWCDNLSDVAWLCGCDTPSQFTGSAGELSLLITTHNHGTLPCLCAPQPSTKTATL